MNLTASGSTVETGQRARVTVRCEGVTAPLFLVKINPVAGADALDTQPLVGGNFAAGRRKLVFDTGRLFEGASPGYPAGDGLGVPLQVGFRANPDVTGQNTTGDEVSFDVATFLTRPNLPAGAHEITFEAEVGIVGSQETQKLSATATATVSVAVAHTDWELILKELVIGDLTAIIGKPLK